MQIMQIRGGCPQRLLLRWVTCAVKLEDRIPNPQPLYLTFLCIHLYNTTCLSAFPQFRPTPSFPKSPFSAPLPHIRLFSGGLSATRNYFFLSFRHCIILPGSPPRPADYEPRRKHLKDLDLPWLHY